MAMLGGTASIEVEASLEKCWELIEDVPIAPEWQNGLKAMNVKERDAEGRALVVETVNDAKVKEIKSTVRFTYAAPNRLSWKQEKGELKRLDGSWELEELGPERTKVTYWLEGDPGRMLGMLVKGPVEGEIRKRMVEVRPGELKARVEGSA